MASWFRPFPGREPSEENVTSLSLKLDRLTMKVEKFMSETQTAIDNLVADQTALVAAQAANKTALDDLAAKLAAALAAPGPGLDPAQLAQLQAVHTGLVAVAAGMATDDSAADPAPVPADAGATGNNPAPDAPTV